MYAHLNSILQCTVDKRYLNWWVLLRSDVISLRKQKIAIIGKNIVKALGLFVNDQETNFSKDKEISSCDDLSMVI